MDKKINAGELTDRELLLVMCTKLENHLQHHDFFTKIALTAGLIGVVNFTVGLLLVLIQFGFLGAK